MANLLVRDWSAETLDRVKARAKAHKRSISAEVQVLVEKGLEAENAMNERKPFSLAELIRGNPISNRSQADIDADVRALRDEW